MDLRKAIRQLGKIIAWLGKNHAYKKFTLDGRLVGDLGEVLAEEHYDISLFTSIKHLYDATTRTGKKVQIKATFGEKLTFPTQHIPELFLGLKIQSDGSFYEVYNGPGKYIKKLLANRTAPYNRLYILSIKSLSAISATISIQEKIKTKRGKKVVIYNPTIPTRMPNHSR